MEEEESSHRLQVHLFILGIDPELRCATSERQLVDQVVILVHLALSIHGVALFEGDVFTILAIVTLKVLHESVRRVLLRRLIL